MLTSELTLCRNSKSRAYFLSLLVPLLCVSVGETGKNEYGGNRRGRGDKNNDICSDAAGRRNKEREGVNIVVLSYIEHRAGIVPSQPNAWN